MFFFSYTFSSMIKKEPMLVNHRHQQVFSQLLPHGPTFSVLIDFLPDRARVDIQRNNVCNCPEGEKQNKISSDFKRKEKKGKKKKREHD